MMGLIMSTRTGTTWKQSREKIAINFYFMTVVYKKIMNYVMFVLICLEEVQYLKMSRRLLIGRRKLQSKSRFHSSRPVYYWRIQNLLLGLDRKPVCQCVRSSVHCTYTKGIEHCEIHEFKLSINSNQICCDGLLYARGQDPNQRVDPFFCLPKAKHQQCRRKVLIQLYCLRCRKTNRLVLIFLLRDARLIFDTNLLPVMSLFSLPFCCIITELLPVMNDQWGCFFGYKGQFYMKFIILISLFCFNIS